MESKCFDRNLLKKAFMFIVIVALIMCGNSISYAQIAGNTQDIYSYELMEKDLQDITNSNPVITELRSLAVTVDGRNIYCLRIGKENAEHKVFLNGSIHAREYITTELVMQQTFDLLNNLKSENKYRNVPYKSLLSNTALYVVPMINPDGVSISQYGIDGLRNQATKKMVEKIAAADGAADKKTYYKKWKSNAEGIDVNRQFDALWNQYNDGIGHPSSDHYKGTKPGMVNEAKALIALTEKEAFERTISYHTQGGVIYWYFGQEGELYNDTKKFADEIASITGYPLDSNYKKLDPAGYKDWAISKKSIPSLTLEVGSGTNPLEHSQLKNIYERNKDVVPEMLLSIYNENKNRDLR